MINDQKTFTSLAQRSVENLQVYHISTPR